MKHLPAPNLRTFESTAKLIKEAAEFGAGHYTRLADELAGFRDRTSEYIDDYRCNSEEAVPDVEADIARIRAYVHARERELEEYTQGRK